MQPLFIIIEDDLDKAKFLINAIITVYGTCKYRHICLVTKDIYGLEKGKSIYETSGNSLRSDTAFITYAPNLFIDEINMIEGSFGIMYDLTTGKGVNEKYSIAIGALLRKQNTKGAVLIYSSLANVENHRKIIRDTCKKNNIVDTTNVQVSDSETATQVVVQMMNLWGKAYLGENRWIVRIWPDFTKHWFDSGFNAEVPHSWNPKQYDGIRVLYDKYLKHLLEVDEIPEQWLDTNGIGNLHEQLKTLVGKNSAKQGDGGKHLSLGAALLLILAALIGNENKDILSKIKWINTNDILPKQDEKQHIESVIKLITLFELMRINEETNDLTLYDITFTEKTIQIWLNININNQVIRNKKNNKTLLYKLQNIIDPDKEPIRELFSGEVFNAYFDFMRKASISENAKVTYCKIDFYSENGKARVEIRSTA